MFSWEIPVCLVFLRVFISVFWLNSFLFVCFCNRVCSVCQERKHRAESDMCTEAEKAMQNCSFSPGDRLPCMDNECYAQKVVARGSQHMQNLSYLKWQIALNTYLMFIILNGCWPCTASICIQAEVVLFLSPLSFIAFWLLNCVNGSFSVLIFSVSSCLCVFSEHILHSSHSHKIRICGIGKLATLN